MKSINKTFARACEKGETFLAKLLTEKFNVNVAYCNNLAFRKACENGHSETAEWLLSVFRSKIFSLGEHSWHNETFLRTCENGFLNTAKLLYKNYPFISLLDKEKNKNSLNKIISSGRTEVVDFLVSKFPEADFGRPDFWSVIECCKNGNLDMVKWLTSTFQIRLGDYMLLTASSFGNLDIVMWLLENGKYTNEAINEAFYTSCVDEKLEVADFLYKKYETSIVQNNNFIVKCATKGKDASLRYLLPLFENVNVEEIFEAVLNADVYRHRFSMLKHLTKTYSLDMNGDDTFLPKMFRNACWNSLNSTNDNSSNTYFCICKWLHENFKCVRDYTDLDILNRASSVGDLEFVKWLFSSYYFPDVEVAFLNACENDQLEVAKFLYEHRDIEDYTVQRAWRATPNIETTEWLESLNEMRMSSMRKLVLFVFGF